VVSAFNSKREAQAAGQTRPPEAPRLP
jgi:hypothetical protein